MSLDPSPTFRTVRLREGYDVAEVDAFLERTAAALQHDPPTMPAEEVERQRFRPVRARTGYEMSDVDDHLDQLADELRRRNGSGGATETPAQPSVVQRQPSAPWVPLLLVAIAVLVVLVLVR